MHTPLIILADSHTCLSHGDDMEQSTHPLLVNACKGDWMSSDKEQIGAFWSESVAEKYQHREESLVSGPFIDGMLIQTWFCDRFVLGRDQER